MQCNVDIRIALLKNDIKQWRVARLLNISESQFSKMLRKELSKEQKLNILNAIEQIVNENDGFK